MYTLTVLCANQISWAHADIFPGRMFVFFRAIQMGSGDALELLTANIACKCMYL